MRHAFRLLPLPLGIALSLPAMAADKPVNWGLCPAGDVLPDFSGQTGAGAGAESRDRTAQPTTIEGDQLSGTDTAPEYHGNVALHRGDQFLGADNLSYDSIGAFE